MVELYLKFRNILIYKNKFLYIVCFFYCLVIEDNLYSIDYERSFFKGRIKYYNIDSNINGVSYRSYIVYGKNKIEDIIDPVFLKEFNVIENNRQGSSSSYYIYPKVLDKDIFIVIDSFDLKTESFKIITFYNKRFLESFINKKNIKYLGRLNLNSLNEDKDINIYQSLSYKINDISIYTHLIHSKNLNILDKVILSLKNSGYIALQSSFKDSSFSYSVWKKKDPTNNYKDSLVYLDYFLIRNQDLILNPMFLTNLDNQTKMEMFIYEIF